MDTIWIDQQAIPLRLQFQKRKSISMRFEGDVLLMKAPHRMPMPQIEAFIQRKQAWILKAQSQAKHLASLQNALFLYNRAFTVVYHEGQTLQADFEGTICHIRKPSRLSESSALDRLKRQWAMRWILPIMEEEIARSDFKPSAVKLKALKSSWGRCSSKKEITLSLRLIECDPLFIRYVCVHELAHLHHLDHSARFWAKVEERMPAYRQVLKLTPYHQSVSL